MKALEIDRVRQVVHAVARHARVERFAFDVVPDAHDVVGLPVLRGRTFEDGEGTGSRSVVIVNQLFANKYWPGEDGIGKRIRLVRDSGDRRSAVLEQPLLTVVGVVPDPIPVSAMTLLMAQRSVSGSPSGSPATLAAMLDFCARHKIAPVVERFPLSKANEALAHLRAGKARYRIVLDNDLK